jgi:hypothetical protein
MKLCPKCGRSPLAFFVVFFIAGVSAYLTWLTLTLSMAGVIERIVGTLVIFAAVGATLLHYVLSCMKRHCRHGEQLPRA